jgi:hypothetical protein
VSDTPSYEVNDVFTVLAVVSCEEAAVWLKDVFAEGIVEATAWKERAMSRDGFLNESVAGSGAGIVGLTGCLPFEVLVNFGDLADPDELSEGRFLAVDREET